MKRLLCFVLALCLAAAAAFSAAANGLPFDKPDAPDGLTFLFTYPNDGNECIEAVFTVPDALCRVASLTQAQQEKYYGAAFESCVQFDWSVDSDKAFHYDESWDSIGGSYPIQKLTGSFVDKCEVFWFAYPEAVQRCKSGIVNRNPEKGEVYAFDFDNHKLYVRARFLIYDYQSQTCTFSDWSDVGDVGAARTADKPDVPQVGESRIDVSKASLDGNVLTFDAQPSGSIRDIARALLCTYNPQLSLISQMRVDGGAWEYRSMTRGDMPYLVGVREVELPETTGKIELRCRLTGNNPTDGTAIITGWSDLLTVEDGKVQIVPNDDPFDVKAEEKRQADAAREANRCTLCGICPVHPFGVCMFIWLGGLLLVALIVVYNILASKKKKQRAAQIRAREEASRQTGEDKTGSFVMTDRISLQGKAAQEQPAEETSAPAEEENNDAH